MCRESGDTRVYRPPQLSSSVVRGQWFPIISRSWGWAKQININTFTLFHVNLSVLNVLQLVFWNAFAVNKREMHDLSRVFSIQLARTLVDIMYHSIQVRG